MALIGNDRLNFTAFDTYYNTTTGHHVDYARIYAVNESPPSGYWGTSTGNVASRIAAGYKVVVSFKSSFSWAQVASGSDDARLTSIGSYLNGLDASAGNYIAFGHEPENDGGVSADFRAAQSHIYPILKAQAPNWSFGQILMGSTLASDPNHVSGRVYTDWFVPSASDYLGVDWYNYRGSSAGDGNGWCSRPDLAPRNVDGFQEWLDIAVAAGVPRIIIPESTCYVRNPATFPGSNPTYAATSFLERTLWYNQFSTRWRDDPRLEVFSMYSQDNTQGFGTSILYGGSNPVVAAEPNSVLALDLLRTPSVAPSSTQKLILID